MSTRIFALVPAAGSGSRLGGPLPKQYLPLLGRPLIHHALERLCDEVRIERVYVVLAKQDRLWRAPESPRCAGRVEAVFAGGPSRAASVVGGLHALPAGAEDWVLVHDAARPCLPAAMLRRLIDELVADLVGGILAVPVADTLKLAGPDGRILHTQPRERLWQAQTPQMFRYGLLRRALEQAGPEVTDEASAVEALGQAPRLIESDSRNLKVTYARDLELARLILEQLND